MSQTPTRFATAVSFPVSAPILGLASFKLGDRWFLAYCGGGGSSKSGVGNSLTVVEVTETALAPVAVADTGAELGAGVVALVTPSNASKKKKKNESGDVVRIVACFGDKLRDYELVGSELRRCRDDDVPADFAERDPLVNAIAASPAPPPPIFPDDGDFGEVDGFDDDFRDDAARLEGERDSATTASRRLPPTALRKQRTYHHLATGGEDTVARFWALPASVTDGPCAKVRECRGHSGPVTAASYARGGHLVCTASKDGTCRIWSAALGVCYGVVDAAAVTPAPAPPKARRGKRRAFAGPAKIMCRSCCFDALDSRLVSRPASLTINRRHHRVKSVKSTQQGLVSVFSQVSRGPLNDTQVTAQSAMRGEAYLAAWRLEPTKEAAPSGEEEEEDDDSKGKTAFTKNDDAAALPNAKEEHEASKTTELKRSERPETFFFAPELEKLAKVGPDPVSFLARSAAPDDDDDDIELHDPLSRLESHVIVGDVEGNVSIAALDDLRVLTRRKRHDLPVTGLVVLDDVVLSASADYSVGLAPRPPRRVQSRWTVFAVFACLVNLVLFAACVLVAADLAVSLFEDPTRIDAIMAGARRVTSYVPGQTFKARVWGAKNTLAGPSSSSTVSFGVEQVPLAADDDALTVVPEEETATVVFDDDDDDDAVVVDSEEAQEAVFDDPLSQETEEAAAEAAEDFVARQPGDDDGDEAALQEEEEEDEAEVAEAEEEEPVPTEEDVALDGVEEGEDAVHADPPEEPEDDDDDVVREAPSSGAGQSEL